MVLYWLRKEKIMKTKQIIGIIITGIVIIAVGVTGAFTNAVSNKIKENQAQTSKSIFNEVLSSSTNTIVDLPSGNFIGVLNIEGTIGASTAGSWSSSV